MVLPSRGPAGVALAGRVQVVAKDAPGSGMGLEEVEKLFGEEVSFESMIAKSPRK